MGSDNGLVPTGNKPLPEPMLNYMVSDNGLVPTGNKPLPEPMLNRVILSGTNNFACVINTNSKVKEDNMYFIYVQGNDIGNDISNTCLNVPELGRYWSSAGSSGLVRARFWYITACWYGYTTLFLHIVHIHTESNDVNVVIVHVDTHIYIYWHINNISTQEWKWRILTKFIVTRTGPDGIVAIAGWTDGRTVGQEYPFEAQITFWNENFWIKKKRHWLKYFPMVKLPICQH